MAPEVYAYQPVHSTGLRIVVRKAGGWRWPLVGETEGLEIWRGTDHVGTISATLLTQIVHGYLRDVALRDAVRLELLEAVRAPLPHPAVARRPRLRRRAQRAP